MRIFNSFMKAMNANKLLPRMILMVLDWDLLQFIDHCSYGISMLCGQVINWLLRNIERTIESCKEELRKRRAGAVLQNEPKIIWVKMINRSNPQWILSVCTKFNNALEELLVNRCYHYILDVNKAVFEGRNFTYNNLLNVRGQQVYWLEIDQIIERFDYHEESL